MDAAVQRIIDDLAVAAERRDAGKANRLDRWRVPEPDAGRFLWLLGRTHAAASPRPGSPSR